MNENNKNGNSILEEKTDIEDKRARELFFENLKWLNSNEAVIYLRLSSLGALRNLVYRRKIPFVKLGHRLRFDREALDRLLESAKRHGRISI